MRTLNRLRRSLKSIVLLLPVVCTPSIQAQTQANSTPTRDAPTRCERAFEQSRPVQEMMNLCREELLGPVNDKDRIDILQTLGQVYLSQGESELAIAAWREAAQYTQPLREYPAQIDRWTRLQVLVGQTYAQLGQNQEAEDQFQRTLKKVSGLVGPYALPSGVVNDALGTLYALMGKQEESLSLFKRARIVHEIRLGKYHPRTIETRLNHGVGLLDLGKETEAKAHFQVLSDVIQNRPNYQNAPIRAEILTFLGTLQMRDNEVDRAIGSYKVAYQVRENYFGATDLRTSQSLNNLGVVLYRAGDLKGAEEALSRAYVIRRELLGVDDPLTNSTQTNLRAVIQAQEDKAS